MVKLCYFYGPISKADSDLISLQILLQVSNDASQRSLNKTHKDECINRCFFLDVHPAPSLITCPGCPSSCTCLVKVQHFCCPMAFLVCVSWMSSLCSWSTCPQKGRVVRISHELSQCVSQFIMRSVTPLPKAFQGTLIFDPHSSNLVTVEAKTLSRNRSCLLVLLV